MLEKATYPFVVLFFFFLSFFQSQSYLSATGVFVDLKVEEEGEPNKNHTLIEGNIRLLLNLQRGRCSVCLSL